MRILAVTQGQWGERIAENVSRACPSGWAVQRWAAPRVLPAVIDDPDDFLPSSLPAADLVLALGEAPGLASLIPDIVQRCGAQAVIAPIDRNESLPAGLVSQLRAWLSPLGVAAVFPKPFCSLGETSYSLAPIATRYDNALIREFAHAFGQPRFQITVDADRQISQVVVERGSACGCAGHVAHGLLGCPVGEAEYEAGMLHHHFPCLASMNQDADYHDTLMHVSGHILREAVKAEIQDYLEIPYLRPPGKVEPGEGR